MGEDRDPRAWRLVAGAVVVALLVGTAALTWQSHRQIEERHDDAFAYEAARVDDAIRQRMAAYVQVLLGGVGLFEASDDVGLGEWIRYVDTLRVQANYPGFKSLSFAAAVPETELDAFVATVRGQPVPPGMADPSLLTAFTVRPPGEVAAPTPLHSPIVFVAPWVEENQRVLGVDMMAEPTRRAVMEAAAASGDAMLTPRVRLAGQGDEEAGFIAYLPVRRDGALLGWLTAAFRAEQFLVGLFGDAPPPIAFEIEDGAGGLLYSTEPSRADGSPVPLPTGPDGERTRRSTIELPGRSWEVRYVAGPGFATGNDTAVPWLVATGGVLLSLLVLVVVRAGAGWRTQADRLAAQSEALRRTEAAVRHEATHDALTGLANRASFRAALDDATGGDEAVPFVVAYVDIDGFKPVNDRHGHDAGDQALVGIAGRMRSRLRADDLVARIGGDEFAVLLRDAADPPARAVAYCEDLVRRLAEPLSLEVAGAATVVSVGASVGLARFPADGGTADELLGAADAAMYQAKRAGRSRLVVADEAVTVG